jgi:hypothetical protein
MCLDVVAAPVVATRTSPVNPLPLLGTAIDRRVGEPEPIRA